MHKYLNILFIADSFYPHTGGVEKHVFELSKKLIENGNKVTVITYKKDVSDTETEIVSGIKVFRLSKTNSKYSNYAGLLFQIYSKGILKGSYDIVHYHDYSAFNILNPILLLKQEIRNKKTYITFHGWEGIFPVPDHIRKKRLYCEEKTNGNICIGHFIEKWYGTEADIITYGAVDEKSYNIIPKKKILYAGRLEADTGFPVLLEAFIELAIQYPEYKLVVCGEGSLSDKLKDKTNVIFKGRVDDTTEFVANAEIIFASGYLSMLEAFIMKKKVLGYYDNELKKDYFELIPGCKDMMWTAGNKEDVIKAFKEMLCDNSKINAAYDFAKKHSWENLRQEYYKLWNL